MYRLYWVDSSLPGIRSVRQNGTEHKVILQAESETFQDVTVYHVRLKLCSHVVHLGMFFCKCYVCYFFM